VLDIDLQAVILGCFFLAGPMMQSEVWRRDSQHEPSMAGLYPYVDDPVYCRRQGGRRSTMTIFGWRRGRSG